MRRAKLSAAALARLEHDVRNTYLTFRALGKSMVCRASGFSKSANAGKSTRPQDGLTRREALASRARAPI